MPRIKMKLVDLNRTNVFDHLAASGRCGYAGPITGCEFTHVHRQWGAATGKEWQLTVNHDSASAVVFDLQPTPRGPSVSIGINRTTGMIDTGEVDFMYNDYCVEFDVDCALQSTEMAKRGDVLYFRNHPLKLVVLDVDVPEGYVRVGWLDTDLHPQSDVYPVDCLQWTPPEV